MKIDPPVSFGPISVAQVVLFRESRNYNELARVVWTAMAEAVNFFSLANLIIKSRRLVCFPAAGILKEELPAEKDASKYLADADHFWAEVRAPYSRTYAQAKIVQQVRKQFFTRATEKLFIVTDQEICPPKNWRYILWDGTGADVVISIAAMDPRYWGQQINDIRSLMKHRCRTALINTMGEEIGISRCMNEQCLEFDNIDSVTRLDEMLYLGTEHSLAELTGRGFAPESNNPEELQPVILFSQESSSPSPSPSPPRSNYA
jgi:hypothetical protein